MRRGLVYILIAMVVLTLGSCHERKRDNNRYRVTVRLTGDTVRCDSGTLVVLDEDYGHLRVLQGARLSNSTLTFSGHFAEACIAYVDFHTDSLPYQFYFILEPCPIDINISPHEWLIKGGRGNLKYQQFLNRCAHLSASRDSLWQAYVRMGADSTLTWNKERAALRADSVLQDSLQRIIVERINRGDLASRLVKQRLLPQLTRESLNKIK
ncbi:MAG: hypothetical protein IJ613_07520 [Muribaculaceae bacterium]|nr:hypothetical protein [Muribaculaceae bacterium]